MPYFKFIKIVLCLPLLTVFVESRVCGSLDVRNSPKHIEDFRDCRIIEGHLQVVLMEAVDDITYYYNSSFSELYEITDYLIVFKVKYLSSLELIFPKLAYIRGRKLFFGHSLVLYNLDHLEEIGLRSLHSIDNGNVRIKECPKLCYVETVNWTALGVSTISHINRSKCEGQYCPYYCGGYCWNNFECQNQRKVINKCHPSCIGCRKENSAKHCLLCKYFNNSGTCVESCPESKLTDNFAAQCISITECTSKKSGSVFNNNCIPNCPRWHHRNEQGNCTPSAEKLCDGIKIVNHSELEKMIGCTHIDGSLEIVLSEYVKMDDLEYALGLVVSISEYLKISRTNSITSLQFLKNLKIVRGEKLWSRYYAVFVTQNQNLQKLWDFNEHSNLVVEKGEVFFQDNPYLCAFEVEKWKNVTLMTANNGYQTSCNVAPINVTVVEIYGSNVTLSWMISNDKTVIGYDVFYIKLSTKDGITEENDILLHLKDGFKDDEGQPFKYNWNNIFASNASVQLKQLTPCSRYGYYIRTLPIQSEPLESSILYFNTTMDDPSEVLDFEAESKSDTVILLKWNRPLVLNGPISHYRLTIYIHNDYLPMIRQRNYCKYPHIENTCVCPIPDEVQRFTYDAICSTDNKTNYCKKYDAYEIIGTNNSSKFRLLKRSIFSAIIFDENINVADGEHLNFTVHSLRHFTMYTFFIKPCNKDTKSGLEYCGGPETTSQRTIKSRRADVIQNFNVKVNGSLTVATWSEPEDPNSVIVAYTIEYKKKDVNSTLSEIKCIPKQQHHTKKYKYSLSGLQNGTFDMRIRAISLAGPGDWTQWKQFTTDLESTGINWVYGFLGVAAVLILIIFTLLIRRRYKLVHNTYSEEVVRIMNIFEREEDLNEENEWKLDDETIEIVKELGQNSLTVMYRR